MAETKTIVIERAFDVPVEKVWQAWTDPEQVKKWWGPEGFTAPSVKIDLKVGGKFIGAMHGPKGSEWDKDMYSSGVYKAIVPPDPDDPTKSAKIVSSDYFSDAEGNLVSAKEYDMGQEFGELTVTVTFEAQGDKTRLTLRHEGFPAGEDVGAEQGWNESLDKLAATLK